jgi:ATP-dependent Clp protease ATP-binding subunit ClpA
MIRIVDKFVDELRAPLAERKVRIVVTDDARSRLAVLGHDPKFGARPLARVIDDTIKKPATEELLFGRLEQGGTLTVDVEDDTIVLRYA